MGFVSSQDDDDSTSVSDLGDTSRGSGNIALPGESGIYDLETTFATSHIEIYISALNSLSIAVFVSISIYLCVEFAFEHIQ